MPASTLLFGALLLAPGARAQDLLAFGARVRVPVGAGDLDWDDDGDCYCEVGPCEGSVRPECGAIEDGDCLDSPADDRSNDANPGRDEDCTDVLDNDCNGFVNDGCTQPARYATVQGGGCASAPGSSAGALLSTLLLALCRPRRRS